MLKEIKQKQTVKKPRSSAVDMAWIHSPHYNKYAIPKTKLNSEQIEYLNNLYKAFRLSDNNNFSKVKIFKNAISLFTDLGGLYFISSNELNLDEIKIGLESKELNISIETIYDKKFNIQNFINSNKFKSNFNLIKRGKYLKNSPPENVFIFFQDIPLL